jgi:SNF2 family DNA or RNA helicase
VPMRYGKTKVAIDFAGAMYFLERVRRVLVICPLDVIGVWEDELKKHANVPWQTVKVGSLGFEPGEMWWPEEIDAFRDGVSFQQWRIVNFEQLYSREYDKDRTWFPVTNRDLIDYDADLIIVDESHRIGNPGAVTSKFLYQLARRARFRVFMTGTMFHRQPLMVFGQFKFYDPAVFGIAFKPFKDTVAIYGGYLGKEILEYQNLEWMMDKVKPHVWIEPYVKGVEPVHREVPFHLTGRNLKYYSDMEDESIIEVGGEEVISPIVLSKHLRCQQIAGGWVKTETKYRRVGTDKLNMWRERLKTYSENDVRKIVVGHRFKPEMADSARAAEAAGYPVFLMHGGVDKDERRRRIAAFNEAEAGVFVAQVATAKEGIDLSSADTMCFYSLPESYVDFDQFSRRIEKYNEQRTLQYDYLAARGTRDEVTLEALRLKRDVAHFLATNPKRVQEITKRKFRKSQSGSDKIQRGDKMGRQIDSR